MEPETQIITKLIIPVVILILNIVLTALVGLVMLFLKNSWSSIRDKFSEQEQKIEAVKDDLSEFKAILPQQYVLRDDFIRTMTSFDTKMDRITQTVKDELSGFKVTLPQQYVLREDYNRAMAGVDTKLDKIVDKLGRDS